MGKRVVGEIKGIGVQEVSVPVGQERALAAQMRDCGLLPKAAKRRRVLSFNSSWGTSNLPDLFHRESVSIRPIRVIRVLWY